MLHIQISDLAFNGQPPEKLESVVLQLLGRVTAWRACLPHLCKKRFITLILGACLSEKAVAWLANDSLIAELANGSIEHLGVFAKARLLPE